MTIHSRKLLIYTVMWLSGGMHAFAQETPVVDISGGYSLVRRVAALDTASFHGWTASVTGHWTPSVAIVGEVSGNYLTFDEFVTIKSSTHTYMGGGRFTLRRSSMSPFAQVLMGAGRDAASGNEPGFGKLPGVVRTRFQVQAGAGVDARLYRRLILRAGADYRLKGLKGLRVHAGLAFGVGSR
jgi:hypothetical protein